MIFDLLFDALKGAVLVTGLVVVMMMMIESFNISTSGKAFGGLRRSRVGQVLLSSFLGSIPGCMGGFASVSLYTHGMISFGALVAMMIASSGDEAFIMLAMFPDKAWWIFLILLGIAIVSGLLVDFVRVRRGRELDAATCSDGLEIHSEDELNHEHKHGHRHGAAGSGEVPEDEAGHKAWRHFSWKRLVMFIGVTAFIGALAFGLLEHDHDHEIESVSAPVEHMAPSTSAASSASSAPLAISEAETTLVHGHNAKHLEPLAVVDKSQIIEPDGQQMEPAHHDSHSGINLLSEDWMNILFAVLSLVVLCVIVWGSDHFVNEHLWHHVVCKHLPRIFAWTFGVLIVLGILTEVFDVSGWISNNTVLMILLATAIGIIPESGPHLIFVTLFASGVVPLPVLLASCISQDGHASLPLLAESKKDFLKAKAVNCVVALLVGFLTYFLL